jgi:hypothetical protein
LCQEFAAEAQRHRLVHRAIVEDRHVDFLVGALRLHPGDVVGGVAGDVLGLRAGLLFERGQDDLAHHFLVRTAVGGDGELLLRRRAGAAMAAAARPRSTKDANGWS